MLARADPDVPVRHLVMLALENLLSGESSSRDRVNFLRACLSLWACYLLEDADLACVCDRLFPPHCD